MRVKCGGAVRGMNSARVFGQKHLETEPWARLTRAGAYLVLCRASVPASPGKHPTLNTRHARVPLINYSVPVSGWQRQARA
jgi:hypothetical protein